ncbi:MAG: mannose-1-phosphate guanylyltransferase [Candidatus Omnitrophica bacterium]|nr:mannose-1-phosphate guanylyltransferase [Candidatus Omnitrophota bacterium]
MSIPRERFWGVLMAGGQGERLWPWSRRNCPKQFLAIGGRNSLLQAAYARLNHLMPADHIFVIGNAEHAGMIRKQLPQLSKKRWVPEPVGRNTAAAAGLGALLIGREDPGAVMVVATADHVIAPAEKWAQCARAAGTVALEDVDRLVCIGIQPAHPATGYGYIDLKPDRKKIPGSGLWAAPIKRYVEKPNLAGAKKLIARGAYWNSGMFVWSVPAIARALQRCLPELTRGLVKTIHAQVGTPAFARQLKRLYGTIPSISIDYGVMEHAPDCWMVPGNFAWDDVGSWSNLRRYLTEDRDGNAVQGLHVGVDTQDCLVFSNHGQLIATAGVKNLIVAQCGDVTLVADPSRTQEIKKLVNRCLQNPKWSRRL